MVKQKKMVTFDRRKRLADFLNSNFYATKKSISEKEKEIRKTPKFCANQVFMKNVTLGAFISANIPNG